MPSSYPFPTLASLSLSLYVSARKTEKLPRITTYCPADRVEIVACPTHLRYAIELTSGAFRAEGI